MFTKDKLKNILKFQSDINNSITIAFQFHINSNTYISIGPIF